jgi:hypothetical protein
MSEAETAERAEAIASGKRVVDYLNSRRKAGKGLEYEVKGGGLLPGELRAIVLPDGYCRRTAAGEGRVRLAAGTSHL